MNKKLNYFLENFETIVGSITISVTVVLVIVNVFLRYGLGIQFPWVEEVSVGCFIWSVFLGATAGYKTNSLIGVDILTQILPERMKKGLEIIVQGFLLTLSGTLFYLSFNYTMASNKITSALEVSYIYINSSLVIAFGLMTLYSALFFAKKVIDFSKTTEAITESEKSKEVA